jgi:peroxiredoxin
MLIHSGLSALLARQGGDMNRCFLFLLMMVVLTSAAFGFEQDAEYIGKLNPELVEESMLSGMRLKKATPEEIASLPVQVPKNEKLFSGRIYEYPRIKYAGVSVFLHEKNKGMPDLFVDLDENGKLTASERFPLVFVKGEQGDTAEVSVKIPLKKGDFKLYPVKFAYPIGQSSMEETRLLRFSYGTYAQGVVEIQGRKTMVQYQVTFPAGELNPTKGYLGVDSNGDGKVDTSFVSYETAYARDEAVIFRAGKDYISTKSVDGATGKIVFKAHPAADYQRIELEIGSEIADFKFTDFDGKERSLSEYRGKYLLLEFWGTWCGPCVAEVPNFKEAYAKYKARGFEILGMDEDQSVDNVKKFLTEKAVTWTNATTPSIKELTNKKFRIVAFPTTILLDPKGKIVSMGRKGQLPLRGKELLETLEKLLPAAQKAGQ